MSTKIITISDRGQVTIPAKIRKEINAEHFHCKVQNGQIILIPLIAKETTTAKNKVSIPVKTEERPDANLEEAEMWSKHGGLTIEEAIKKARD